MIDLNPKLEKLIENIESESNSGNLLAQIMVSEYGVNPGDVGPLYRENTDIHGNRYDDLEAYLHEEGQRIIPKSWSGKLF